MRTTSLALLLVAIAVPAVAAACGSESESETPAAPTATQEPTAKKPTPDPTSTGTEEPPPPNPDSGTPQTGCPRTPKAPDHVRKVVVSHPFGEPTDGGVPPKANAYEVLELSTTGTLTKTNETFTMGRSLNEIVFTPDGEVGVVPQEDGTLGIFKFDSAGKLTVVNPAFKGSFYAAKVVMSKDGSRVFVLDRNTKENKGGVYEVRIACDGTPSDVGLVAPGGKAHAMALIPNDPDRAVLIAGAFLDSPATHYSHKLDVTGTPPVRITGGALFDQDAIASAVAVTPDGKWALVTDNGLFKGNRMAPVDIATMNPAATITVQNPVNIIMSPFGNAALLVESDGKDHLKVVNYDAASATTPFTVGAELAYVGGKSELPYNVAAVEVGTLKGRILVSELASVRQVAFAANGTLTDVQKVDFSGEFSGITGSMGMQP